MLVAKEKIISEQVREIRQLRIALRELIKYFENEKNDPCEKMVAVVKKSILPYLNKIKSRKIDKESRTYLAIIESNLNSIPSLLPLSSANYLQNLTITENQVADLIKQGKTSKEIATMLNVSTAAVSFHRNNIRKKLGLSNKKIRLAAHLISGGLKMPE